MIKAVVFDLDGTLLRQRIDFNALRLELGAEPGCDLIAFLDSLPPEAREKALSVISEHERAAAENSELNDGAAEILGYLEKAGIPWAVSTRNSRRSLEAARIRHGLAFRASATREDATPKPSPAPLFAIAEALGVDPGAILSVGDFKFDTESALRAGAVAVYLASGNPPSTETRFHFMIDRLDALQGIIQSLAKGAPLPEPASEEGAI